MMPEEDELLREGREVLERHNQPRDKEEAAEYEAMGQAIMVIRERLNVTREELAEKAGLSVPELKRIESGKVDELWGDLRRVGEGLGIELGTLIRKCEELEPGPIGERWRRRLGKAESDSAKPGTPSDAAEEGEQR